MDPISNMFAQIKNAINASKKEVVIPYSKLKLAILEIFKQKEYIESFEVIKEEEQKYPRAIKAVLKYRNKSESVITDIKRVSRPGRRVYIGSSKIAREMRGKSDLVISTPSGVMSGTEAKKKGLGGEVICEVR